MIRSRRTPPFSNLAAFSSGSLVEVSIMFVIWLFTSALSLPEEISGVDEQYKKLNSLTAPWTYPLLWGWESGHWEALRAPCQEKSQTLLCEYDLTEGTGVLFQSLQPTETKRRLKEKHSICWGVWQFPFHFLRKKPNPQEELCHLAKIMALGWTPSCTGGWEKGWGQRGVATREHIFME